MLNRIMLSLALLLTVSGPAEARTPAAVTPAAQPQKLPQVDRDTATDLASTMLWASKHGKRRWGNASRYSEYARLFVTNGRRWGVDPLLVACVAFAESRFHVVAPPLYRTTCRTVNTRRCGPGPCPPRWRKVCQRKRVNIAEAGMMQVLWYDGSTAKGYQLCTGKDLNKRGRTRTHRRLRAQKQLTPPRVAICVGAYELSRWKRWAYVGGYGRIRCGSRHYKPKPGNAKCHKRMTPRKKRNVRFFRRRPWLRQHFWISFFNWGSNNWAGNFYPRFVLGCYDRFRKRLRVEAMARIKRQQKDSRRASR